MKKIYSIFQSTMIEVEKLRETKIKKINELIVPATVYYPRRAREFKTEMSKINEIKSSKGKQLKELEKAQSVKDADKMSKVNAVIEKYKQEENLKGNEFEERLTNFEQERVMDNKFETEEPFKVTTADMLEIVAGGGNGVEYVDIVSLIETAAKELREKDAKIEQLRGVLLTVLEACEDVNSPDRKVREEITKTVGKALKEEKDTNLNIRLAAKNTLYNIENNLIPFLEKIKL